MIEARGLIKKFGDLTAVDGVDLSIRRGEIFGLLGPNGAGKTTTVRMLTMLLNPTAGEIILDGIDISKNPTEAKKLIGITQQHISLDKDISVWENLKYKAILQGIPRKEAAARIDELSKVMGLGPYMDKLVGDLSGGWKKRTAIVAAIIHNPKILFLDEPTTGLDTQSRHVLWELIRDMRSKGTTIVLTTHYIEEAEALCDRIAMIDHGKVVLSGTPDELCRSFGRWTVEYINEHEKRCYAYFDKKDEADRFISSVGSQDRTMLRRTHLEDVYLETTGRETGASE
ncbi:MAG: ABC transporter ATP-binding protein [Candidatus Methanomethylophilaceae archaeon]|nr:ABC transporter ATP-binding protein [Candidatus Methanomethylophilaceae archaeon]